MTGEISPLSDAQQRSWFFDQLSPGFSDLHLAGARRMRRWSPAALELACREAVRRHGVLRAMFPVVDGAPIQEIAPALHFELPVTDLASLPEPERNRELQRVIRQGAASPFDLASGPLWRIQLIRLGGEDQVLWVTLHPMVGDERSVELLFAEIILAAAQLEQGLPASLPEPVPQYAELTRWQRGRSFAAELAFWREELAGGPPALELPQDHPRPLWQTFRGSSLSFALTPDLETGPWTLLAAFAALLHHTAGAEDFCIGLPVSGRDRPETESLIGPVDNTLALRVGLSGTTSFAELLHRVREVSRKAQAHRELPFAKLVEELRPERDASRSPLFQTLFQERRPAAAGSVALAPWASAFDLSLHVEETEDGLRGAFTYKADLFETTTIQRLTRSFEILLAAAAADSARQVIELPLLSAAERHQLLVEWSAVDADFRDLRVHQLIEEQARRDPAAVALIFRGEILTYGDLMAASRQLASGLLSLQTDKDRPVTILLRSGPWQVIALIGALQAGLAFTCLDPDHPALRLEHILGELRSGLLITDAAGLEQHGERMRVWTAELGLRVLAVDVDGRPEEGILGRESFDTGSLASPAVEVGPLAPIYVVYTSGSTGSPKGICQSHRSFSQFLQWQARQLGIGPGCRVAAWASITYDASYCEIFGALCFGATLCMASKSVRFDPRQLIGWVEDERISLLQVVPSFCRQILRSLAQEFPPGRADPLASLEVLLLAGEVLAPDLARAWLERCPGTELFNLYGPTESVLATWCAVDPATARRPSIPVGWAIDGRQILVLDRSGRPCPLGIDGEIYIRSPYLTLGYFERPEETRRAFLQNPLHTAFPDPVYRTGDVGHYLPDGRLEFVSRIDSQVKIRGMRVELQEIEAAVREHESVGECAVAVHERSAGDPRPVAYLVLAPRRGSLSDGTGLSGDEKDYVAEFETIYDEIYGMSETYSTVDSGINLRSWTSSYTGRQMPEAEILGAVEDTVSRLLALRPRRVLEIGCGSGLLISRIAPFCDSYLGTDLSRQALRHLEQEIVQGKPELSRVRLEHRAAHDFAGLQAGEVDTAILNLVLQHFPGVDYLLGVLENLAQIVAPGGAIFLGSVRSLPLLRAFHTSVQLERAPPRLGREALRERIQEHLAGEKDLVVDPSLFAALRRRIPRLSAVEVHLKGGRSDNEITRFEYDVVLWIEAGSSAPAKPTWIEWQPGSTVSGLRQLLADTEPESLGVSGIPNARVASLLAAVALLEGDAGTATAGELRQALQAASPAGVHPEDLWELARELPYSVAISWSRTGDPSCFDVAFQRRCGREERGPGVAAWPAAETAAGEPWSRFANDPLAARLKSDIAPRLRSFLRGRLPEHMIPAAFLCLDHLPRTRTGKIDRNALPPPQWPSTFPREAYLPPQNPMQRRVAKVWQELLRVDRVGLEDGFFDLGGDSLLAARMIHELRRALDLEIPLRSVFEIPALSAFAGRLAEELDAARNDQRLVRCARNGASRAASPTQQWLWSRHRLDPAGQGLSLAARLIGGLEVPSLAKALRHTVQRHEILRTTFELDAFGQLQQRVATVADLDFAVVDLAALPPRLRDCGTADWLGREACRPFDPTGGPLLRIRILRLAEEEHIFLLVIHRLAGDTVSLRLLVREITRSYEAFVEGLPPDLPELRLQFADYADWQRRRLERGALDRGRAVLRRTLRGAARPSTSEPGSPRGARGAGLLPQQLPRVLTGALRKFSRSETVTTSTTLLAGFLVLLYGATDEDHLIVGCETADRDRTELEELIGPISNPFPLRADLGRDPSFRELLHSVSSALQESAAYRHLPLCKLLFEDTARLSSPAPPWKALFASLAPPLSGIWMPDLKIEPFALTADTTLCDLALFVGEGEETIGGQWVYRTDPLDAAAVERLARDYQDLLGALTGDPDARLSAFATTVNQMNQRGWIRQ